MEIIPQGCNKTAPYLWTLDWQAECKKPSHISLAILSCLTNCSRILRHNTDSLNKVPIHTFSKWNPHILMEVKTNPLSESTSGIWCDANNAIRLWSLLCNTPCWTFYVLSFNPHNNPTGRSILLFSPFYWWGNWNSERLSNLPRTQS